MKNNSMKLAVFGMIFVFMQGAIRGASQDLVADREALNSGIIYDLKIHGRPASALVIDSRLNALNARDIANAYMRVYDFKKKYPEISVKEQLDEIFFKGYKKRYGPEGYAVFLNDVDLTLGERTTSKKIQELNESLVRPFKDVSKEPILNSDEEGKQDEEEKQ